MSAVWVAPADAVQAQQLIDSLEERLRAEALVLRAPPPQPRVCCGRGCNGCVWEGYFEALRFWQEDALSALAAASAAHATDIADGGADAHLSRSGDAGVGRPQRGECRRG